MESAVDDDHDSDLFTSIAHTNRASYLYRDCALEDIVDGRKSIDL